MWSTRSFPRRGVSRPRRSRRSTRSATQHGAVLKDAAVTTPPGWKALYRRWIDGGWNALSGPVEHGGQGLPVMLGIAALEMWNSGAMAFGIGPTLTMGAVEAIDKHGSDELKSIYLPKTRLGRMDGDDEPHRAAGRLRSQCAEVARRAGRRRQLPHLRHQDLHHLWRARFHRQHRPSGAGAAAGRAARHARPVAVPGAEIPGRCGWQPSARATTCSAAASSTSSASTVRRPAR